MLKAVKVVEVERKKVNINIHTIIAPSSLVQLLHSK